MLSAIQQKIIEKFRLEKTMEIIVPNPQTNIEETNTFLSTRSTGFLNMSRDDDSTTVPITEMGPSKKTANLWKV